MYNMIQCCESHATFNKVYISGFSTDQKMTHRVFSLLYFNSLRSLGPNQKKKIIHLALVRLAFTLSFVTLNLKMQKKYKKKQQHQQQKRLLWCKFCITYQTSTHAECWAKCAVVFVYTWWHFDQLRTHDELRKCIKESK